MKMWHYDIPCFCLFIDFILSKDTGFALNEMLTLTMGRRPWTL